MKIPKKAQENIDFLDAYTINPDLETFDALHLYDTGEYGALENGDSQGYVDSKIFDIHVFNFETKEKRIYKFKDGVSFDYESSGVDGMRIYADGSTFIKMKKPSNLQGGQAMWVTDK